MIGGRGVGEMAVGFSECDRSGIAEVRAELRPIRSVDDGANWTSIAAPYEGSFYGILPLDLAGKLGGDGGGFTAKFLRAEAGGFAHALSGCTHRNCVRVVAASVASWGDQRG